MSDSIKYILLILFLVTSFVSCEKDNIDNEKFIGVWISVEASDTLTFDYNYFYLKRSNDWIEHFYEYSYTEDSITIQYAGPNEILSPSTTHSYELLDNILKIDLYPQSYGFDNRTYILKKQF